MKVKKPELGAFVAREYRYDHFAIQFPEYGVPEEEKALVNPLRTPEAGDGAGPSL